MSHFLPPVSFHFQFKRKFLLCCVTNHKIVLIFFFIICEWINKLYFPFSVNFALTHLWCINSVFKGLKIFPCVLLLTRNGKFLPNRASAHFHVDNTMKPFMLHLSIWGFNMRGNRGSLLQSSHLLLDQNCIKITATMLSDQ